MSSEIPDARFRLRHTYAALPELVIDQGPAQGVVIGRNNEREPLEAIYIGKSAETPHRNVWMDVRGAHVLYVMGKRRSGKSYSLGALAEGLVSCSWIKQGRGQPGVIILDTMNVFLTMPFDVEGTEPGTSPASQALRRWKIASETPPLTLFSPASAALPAEIVAETITLRASDLGVEEWCGLFDVDPFVDPMGHLITTLLSNLTERGIARRDTGGQLRPAGRDYALEDLIVALDVDPAYDDFARDTRQALRRRFEALARTALFGIQGLDVKNLLKPGQISVLLLRDLDAEMRAVLVSLVVKRLMSLRALAEQQERVIPIHLARAAKFAETDPHRAESEKRKAAECEEKAKDGIPRAWLIIDEAHNYIPARHNVPSKKPLKKYVDEGRNLGLSIAVATQQPSGLDPSIQRNADLLLVHALSHQDDISAAQGMLNTSIPSEITLDGKYRITGSRTFETLVRNLPLGYAIAVTDRANRLFPMYIRPRATVHGGSDY